MPLRIALCSGQIPFAYGGAEILADSLADRLRRRGHAVEMVRLPFRWYPKEEILKGYLAWRLLNLEESEGRPIDRVIALKIPAYAVPHSHKTTWLIQQLRQAYDLYGTEFSHFDSSEADAELRRTILRMDTTTIGESRRIFAISDNVARRLNEYNGLQAETLYPPPAMEGEYYNAGYGDYVLSVCRLNKLKRVDRLLEAMARTQSPLRCVVVGRGEELEPLQALARQRRLTDRVDFLGYVEDERLLELYANALAVYYAPLDEDYGLATVEAMMSKKPVLTSTDSGGVLEFVDDGVTGYATPSTAPEAMAQALDALYGDRRLAERLGRAGQERVSMIRWDSVLDKLLED